VRPLLCLDSLVRAVGAVLHRAVRTGGLAFAVATAGLIAGCGLFDATRPDDSPLSAVQPYLLREVVTPAGPVRIAFFGSVFPANQPSYVRITDPDESAKHWAQVLCDSADVLVALTHLDVDDDIRIASTIPEIDLGLGVFARLATIGLMPVGDGVAAACNMMRCGSPGRGGSAMLRSIRRLSIP
jgi:hypothetical protein